MTSFSERHGFQPDDVEITVRLDAPDELRNIIIDIAYESGLSPNSLLQIVCKKLRKSAGRNDCSRGWGEDDEVREILGSCEWYRVYDVVETIYKELSNFCRIIDALPSTEYFEREINSYFRQAGIGWQLSTGKIETRGSEAFEHSIAEASSELAKSGRTTAANEIHQAITDLSDRPNPDITGAIQHAIASVECVARDVSGNKQTLGKVLNSNPDLFPPPLNLAIDKMWSFASERGRHLLEGREPNYEEAELIVHVSAAAGIYLTKKHPAKI